MSWKLGKVSQQRREEVAGPPQSGWGGDRGAGKGWPRVPAPTGCLLPLPPLLCCFLLSPCLALRAWPSLGSAAFCPVPSPSGKCRVSARAVVSGPPLCPQPLIPGPLLRFVSLSHRRRHPVAPRHLSAGTSNSACPTGFPTPLLLPLLQGSLSQPIAAAAPTAQTRILKVIANPL